MNLKDFIKIKLLLTEQFEKALLEAEEKNPGSLKCWFRELAKGSNRRA